MKYELTKDLVSGNTLIDQEHRELLEAVNRLMDACASGKGRAAIDSTVKFLLEYVDKHFADEERLQVQSKYPGYAGHKQFHEGYKATLRQIASAIPEAPSIADLSKLNAHVGVLVAHIKSEDKKLAAYLQQA